MSTNPGPNVQTRVNTESITTGFNGTYTVLTQNAALQPLTWTENNIPCSATYNDDGTVATLTKNNITKTFTYTNGVVTGVA